MPTQCYLQAANCTAGRGSKAVAPLRNHRLALAPNVAVGNDGVIARIIDFQPVVIPVHGVAVADALLGTADAAP
jgi:hypothetical protein